MEQHSSDFGRIWRRSVGIGAFALFLTGLLVALDLEELVLIAAVLAALCALAGVLTLALVRYRRGIRHGIGSAGRVTGLQVVRVSRRTGLGGRRVAGASVRAGRRAGLAVAAGGAETARATHVQARRTLPVLRRADDELGVRVRTIATAGRHRAARALQVIVADIHAHQNAIRAADRRRPPESRATPLRSPAARRGTATRSAAERRRGRA